MPHCDKPQAELCQFFEQPAIPDPEQETLPVRAVLQKVLHQTVLQADISGETGPTGCNSLIVNQTITEGIVGKALYACISNVQIYGGDSILLPPPSPSGPIVAVTAYLNGFLGGVGVSGIQSKILTTPLAEPICPPCDPCTGNTPQFSRQLLRAKAWDKFGCFCVNSPYQVFIHIKTNGDPRIYPITRVEYDIILGSYAEVEQKEKPVHPEPDECSNWKSQQGAPSCHACCPENPCGFLKHVPCEGPCVLASGSVQQVPEQLSTINGFSSVPMAVNSSASTTITLTSDQLCRKCHAKLLTNAWCLVAHICIANFEPAKGISLDSVVLDYNALQGVIDTPASLQQFLSVSVGQGVAAILGKIDNQDDLNLAWCYNQFLFQVDNPLVATLTLYPTNQQPFALIPVKLELEIYWSLAYITRVGCQTPEQ